MFVMFVCPDQGLSSLVKEKARRVNPYFYIRSKLKIKLLDLLDNSQFIDSFDKTMVKPTR